MKYFYRTFILFLFFSATISAQTVYLTKSGSKYHSSGCSYLKSYSTAIELSKALEKGYTPCSRCNPPSEINSQSRTDLKENPVKKDQTEKKSTTKKRCIAITKKGTQCKRWAETGSNYCWQHRK